MMDILQRIKAHCIVDHDDDDSKLLRLYDAAVAYLKKSGIPPCETADYELAAFSLVLEWYDGAPIGTVTVGLRQLINQLKLSAVAAAGEGF